jgi:DNA repair exonuclease SbcCD ATPase subunit
MIALNDHGKAVESLTNSIREMKKKLSNLELVMEELDNVKKSMKAAMVEIEENKKSKNELQKLKGSTKVKHVNMALCFLLLTLIGVVCDGTDELGGGSIQPIYVGWLMNLGWTFV